MKEVASDLKSAKRAHHPRIPLCLLMLIDDYKYNDTMPNRNKELNHCLTPG